MTNKDLVEVVLVVLKVAVKGELTIDHERLLQSMVRKFFAIKKVFTDGESIENKIKDVKADLVMWAKEGGKLTEDEVHRQLKNRAQKVKDEIKVEKRRRELEQATPFLFPRRIRTPEEGYEDRELLRKKIEEADLKSRQDFWGFHDEIQHRTEEEWEFMKRLPGDDPLWYFLGVVGMEAFSTFFHDHQGEVFKMPTEALIERTMNLRKSTKEEFVKKSNKWLKKQSSHNLFKK